MKILVAVKQVPERDATVTVAADGRWIDEEDLMPGLGCEVDSSCLLLRVCAGEKAGDGERLGWHSCGQCQ